MSQRKKDWHNKRNNHDRSRGAMGGNRFSCNDDFRSPQRGRGFRGRPPPFRGSRGRDRYSFDSFEANRHYSSWTRNNRSPLVEPDNLPLTEPLQPPDFLLSFPFSTDNSIKDELDLPSNSFINTSNHSTLDTFLNQPSTSNSSSER